MMRRTRFSFFSLLLLTFSAWSATLPKAILVGELKDYIDILSLKESGEIAYIHDDNAKTIKYGMFQGDSNPTELKAWSVYDLLYVEVPQTYETALSMIARGEFESAKKLLDKCGNDKTPSKKLFSATPIYKRYVPHKLFLCALGMNDRKEAISLYKKIDRDGMAHNRMATLKAILPILVEEKIGDLALKVSLELSKLKMAKREAIEISFLKSLALSLQKKYAEAREAINEIVGKYADDYPDLKSRSVESQSTILVDHQKNYKSGIQYLEDIKAKGEVFFSAGMYEKLADCLAQTGKTEEARWNYLHSFLMIEGDKNRMELVMTKIQEMNKKLGTKGGNDGIEALFAKIKK